MPNKKARRVGILGAIFFITGVSLVYSLAASGPDLATQYSQVPNPTLTPGVVRATDLQTIIATEHDAEVNRPNKTTKEQVWQEYGYPGKSDGKHWEYDHLVPIECGGANDINNLWPEPRFGPYNAYDKDQLEDYCGKAIRDGTMSVADAQAIFLEPADWRVEYRKVFGVPSDAR